MNLSRKQTYEFGPFRIDTGERLLWCGATVIPLQPKAVDTLLVLVESKGRIVDRDELLTRVWPNVSVEPNSVDRNISLLRKVLDKTSGDGSSIETVARRGYRFTAPVIEVVEDGVTARSIAVLPLANLSGDPAQDFFVDGMTDELISYLMKIQSLRVSSRTSVMVYKGVTKPLRQIAQELNVAWIVEGTVFHSCDRVRITARLMEGPTEKHAWGDSYEREISDVLALQADVANKIAREIGANLTVPQGVHFLRPRPVNPKAYETYLRGRYFSNKRTSDELRRSIRCFRQAIDEDPTYAPSHAGLADAYSLLGSIGYDNIPPGESMPLAKAAANEALRIDSTLAEARASLGYVKLSYDWDWTGAEIEFKRAIELRPSCATAHHWYGHYLLAMDRMEEAEWEMRKAQELDPLSIPFNLGIGWSFYYARKYDEAIAQYCKTLEIAPNLPIVLYELGLAYQNKGLYREALAEFQRAHTSSRGESAAVMLLGHAHALSGRIAEANEALATLNEMSKRQYVPALYRAFIYAGLNDADEAFQWFEKAYDDRSNYLIYLAVEPSLDKLRSDPRFQHLLHRVGLRIAAA